MQNDPRRFPFCDPSQTRSEKCRSHGAGDGCGSSTSVPAGHSEQCLEGRVDLFLLGLMYLKQIPRIHRGNAGRRNVKGRGPHGSEGCVSLIPEALDPETAAMDRTSAAPFPRRCSERPVVRPVEIHRTWGGIDEAKAGQPPQECS